MADLIAIFQNDRGAKNLDPDFPIEFTAGKAIYDDLQQVEPVLPLFRYNPSSEVNKTSSYGFKIKQSYGILTDAELAALLEERS